jgi:hypothetical protein
MARAFLKVGALLIMFGCTLAFAGCFFLLGGAGGSASSLELGKWDDSIYSNPWANITFTLPPEFELLELDSTASTPGMLTDFAISTDDNSTISLFYVDLSYKDQQNLSPEAYLDLVKQEFAYSTTRDYVLKGAYSDTTIAGEVYVTMHNEFSFKEGVAAEKPGGFQRSHVRKVDNTLIVFIATYSEEYESAINSFFESIRPLS